MAAWVPTDIAGCTLWVRGSSLSALSDGDSVATWTDESGSSRNFTQGTADYRPKYYTNVINGNAIVRFDGTNDWITTASHAVTHDDHDCSIVMVHKDVPYYRGRDSAGAGWSIAISKAGVTLVTTAPSTVAYGTGGTDMTGVWCASFLVFDQTTSLNRYVNNVVNGTPKTPGTNLRASTEFDVIGRSGAATPTYYTGDVAEFIVYDNVVLSEANRKSIWTYLVNKYFPYTYSPNAISAADTLLVPSYTIPVDFAMPAITGADTAAAPIPEIAILVKYAFGGDTAKVPSILGLTPNIYQKFPNADHEHLSMKIEGLDNYGLLLEYIRMKMELYSARSRSGQAQIDFPNATGYHITLNITDISDYIEYMSVRGEINIW